MTITHYTVLFFCTVNHYCDMIGKTNESHKPIIYICLCLFILPLNWIHILNQCVLSIKSTLINYISFYYNFNMWLTAPKLLWVKNRFLSTILPILDRTGQNLAQICHYMEYTGLFTLILINAWVSSGKTDECKL